MAKLSDYILESIQYAYHCIAMERDVHNKVRMKDVEEGLNELKIMLGVK